MLVGGARGDHDDRHPGEALVRSNVAREIEPVHSRHLDVDQHHVGNEFQQLLHRFDAVARRHHDVALALQQSSGDLAHGERIIDHHDRGLRRRGLRLGRFVNDRRAGSHFLQREQDRIQDEDDLARAEHRGARDARDPLQLRTDRLHDDFLVAADHFVHVQRDGVGAAAQVQRRGEALLFGDRVG